jgi:hypothetical protein
MTTNTAERSANARALDAATLYDAAPTPRSAEFRWVDVAAMHRALPVAETPAGGNPRQALRWPRV